VRRSVLLGLTVSDWQGEELGQVIDTWPLDGGGEPELAVIRLGRLGARRMVPLAEVQLLAGWMRIPFARWQVEDSPAYGEDHRMLADDPWRALSYWRCAEPTGTLTAACLPSFGSFATAKPSPTPPSPIPTAS
jgi:hypothetical protein